jgi:LysR family transcriptional regulator for bpeEF and oprC
VDRLRTIEVFSRVAELGSFSRAAASLNLPRASVTAAVQALEARLGAKLLNRTTRRLSLTAAGTLYLEGAGRLVRELEALESNVGPGAQAPAGRVRVDVPAAAGRHVLAVALPEFLALHPGIVVELGSTDRPVDLLAEGVDCALRGGDVHDLSLVARRLGALPVVTCAAPAWVAAHGRPDSPEALAERPSVGFFSPRTGRIFEAELARGADSRTFPPRCRVAAIDADTWLALAVAGLGWIQAPCGVSVRAALADGRLERILPAWDAGELPMAVVWQRDRNLPARTRVFIDWVADVYARECAAAWAFVRGAATT